MDDRGEGAALRASVIVATMSRADSVRICLSHLAEQTVRPFETIVVDASSDDATYRVVSDEFPDVRYLHNPAGPGTLSVSRSLGLAESTGDVIVFIDDDAYARPDWLEQLLQPYADPSVGGVGGQALNGIDGEESLGLDDIGRFKPNGTLSGNFAADPGHDVEVDHFIGANMSFRRRALTDVGGIHDGYPGTCVREETDTALRVKRAGWKLVYTPRASVRHVAAPYPKGQRFDLRYTYFAARNHVVLLTRNCGPASPELRGFLGVALAESGAQVRRAARAATGDRTAGTGSRAHTVGGGLARASAGVAGLAVGMVAGLGQRRSDQADQGASAGLRS